MHLRLWQETMNKPLTCGVPLVWALPRDRIHYFAITEIPKYVQNELGKVGHTNPVCIRN